MVKLTETRFTFLSLNLHFRHLCTHLVYYINSSKLLPNGFPIHLLAFSFSIKFSRQISHRMKEATGEIQKKIAQFIERDLFRGSGRAAIPKVCEFMSHFLHAPAHTHQHKFHRRICRNGYESYGDRQRSGSFNIRIKNTVIRCLGCTTDFINQWVRNILNKTTICFSVRGCLR